MQVTRMKYGVSCKITASCKYSLLWFHSSVNQLVLYPSRVDGSRYWHLTHDLWPTDPLMQCQLRTPWVLEHQCVRRRGEQRGTTIPSRQFFDVGQLITRAPPDRTSPCSPNASTDWGKISPSRDKTHFNDWIFVTC